MSAQSPYEKLGVSEGASFDEIQTARARLIEQSAGDQRRISEIEAAYDALLMERLRLRQEGKIKVPDRIRFPEKLVPPPPTEAPAPATQSSKWLNFIDRPSTSDIALPAALMTGLGTLVYFSPAPPVLQVAMTTTTGSTLFFVYRKERKLGRSVLLGVGGLVLGFAIGGILYPLIEPHVFSMPLNEVFISLVTFFILWVFSSFTK
jgi:hypothetical protein